jgi:NDP-sugar pyrophosphorylase family protein
MRRAVAAGVDDIRMTVHNQPEIVTSYYRGRPLGRGIYVKRFLYEYTPLDTSGGIVRDVVAGINEGAIKPEDTILILGGDIRTDANVAEFLAEHHAKNADISILLSEVDRNEMYRFGGALREGDATPELMDIIMKIREKGRAIEWPSKIYGDLNLNQSKMARILKFFEKTHSFDIEKVINPERKVIKEISKKYNLGPGATSCTNLQNGSVYAFRAELIYHLAPLVFNLPREASANEWERAESINLTGPSRFSDFGGDWFMALTGSKHLPVPTADPKMAEIQRKIVEDIEKGLPQVFGYRHVGRWSDDGTLPAVLKGHFEMLDDLVKNKQDSYWPIGWDSIKLGYPEGIITMSNIEMKDIEIIPPVFIGSGVIIHPGARIGPYAIINREWEIHGTVRNSVLFTKKTIDQEIEGARGWRRFVLPQNWSVEGSLIGSGFEPFAIDQDGNPIPNHKPDSTHSIINKVVVSNGSQNVISPIDI